MREGERDRGKERASENMHLHVYSTVHLYITMAHLFAFAADIVGILGHGVLQRFLVEL